MEKIYERIKKLTPLQWALILNLLMLIPFFFTNTIKYETSDDFMMELIVSGAYGGKPTPEIMFMNVAIGFLLSTLYTTYSNINWYLFFQIATIFSSLCFITFIFLKEKMSKITFLVTFIILSVSSVELYLLIQFTKTASIAMIAGGIGILYYLFNDKEKRCLTLVISFVFIEIGLLIRQQTIYLIVPLFLFCFIYMFFKKKNSLINFKFLLKTLKVCLIVCTLFIINFSVQSFYKNTYPEYKEFLVFNSLRSEIVDYPQPNYYSIQDECLKIGVSETDYLNFLHWNFGDTDFYTIDKLEQLSNILNVYSNNHRVGFIDTFVKLLERNYTQNIILWAIVILLLLFFSKRNFFFLTSSLFISFLLFYFLLYRGRLVYRLEISIFLALLFIFSYLIVSSECKIKIVSRKIILCSIVILCLLRIPVLIPNYSDYAFDIVYLESGLQKYRVGFNDNNKSIALKNEVESNPQNIYVFGFQTLIQSYYFNFDILKPKLFNDWSNCVFLSGVDSYHPVVRDKLSKWGVSNTFDLLGKNNVYLIENSYTEEITDFINQYEPKELKNQLYKEIDEYKIWKYVD